MINRIVAFIALLAFTNISALFSAAADPTKRAADQVVAIEFEDLHVKDVDRTTFKASQLPLKVRELDGRRVRMRGFMMPTPHQFPTVFVLNPETRGDSYVGGWGSNKVPLACTILIRLQDGQKLAYTTAPIEVEGKLSIKPWIHNGELLLLYEIHDVKARVVERRAGFRSCISQGC